jgi:hypothetical protein
MPAYCALCRRPFNGQRELDQHIRNSSAHKKPTQRPSPVQDLQQLKLPPIIPKQREQATSSQVKPVKPEQALNAGSRIHTTTERKHRQPPNTIAFSCSTPQITKPALKTTAPQGAKSPWSVIPESEYTAVLNTLSAHCHSTEQLKENGYILHPYNLLDYVNSRKCKRCNSKFLI